MTDQQTWTPDGPLLPYPGWTPPPKRPKRTALLVAWVLVATAILGCILYAAWPYLKPAQQVPTTHVVVYEVESSGTTEGFLTLEAPTGTQQSKADLPLTSPLSFPFNPGAFVYLSVQNQNDTGSVTCRITDQATTGSYTVSRVISENTSSGGYTIASCKGQVP